jgi:cytochrome d ubiquinol oxidase subunit I
MSLELLSRLQFGFTISFHILFPAFSIGLITFIAAMETAWIKTGNHHYRNNCKFWTKVLALTFGMGIVSGVVMEFQLGTNWSRYTEEVGSVLGPLFTYEVLTAFFIEAGCLGILFFGWERVHPKLHYASTLLAMFGVTLSAFWIMSANSWMQTPAGAIYNGHIFTVGNWLDVIFNPSFLPRFFHMLTATWIASFLAISAIAAHYLLKHKHEHFAKTSLSFAMWALLLLIPLQIFLGDEVGLVMHEYQPIKTAAIEANWETQEGAPLVLFAWPNEKTEKNDYAVTIPKLGSLINTHKLNGELQGLKSVPAKDRPPVPVVFFSFRIMVGLGLLMLLLAVSGLALRYQNKLYHQRWFLNFCILMAPAGFISIITGWFTAEFGRQPWVVYHFLRTADAQSPIHLYQVVISLLTILFVYGIIFGYFYFRFFFKIIAAGPGTANTLLDPAFFYMSPAIGKKDK